MLISIALMIIGCIIAIWLLKYFKGSEKVQAKQIFKAYKHIKLLHPETKDEELFRETARAYFQSLGWDKEKIEWKVEMVVNTSEVDNEEGTAAKVKGVVINILYLSTQNEMLMNFNDKKFKRCFNAAEEAYDECHGNSHLY